MTNSIFTKPTAAGGTGALSDLYTSVTKSLMVKNPGMKNLEAQLTRDSARLSTIGKLALALDQFRTSADRLSGAKLDVGASVSGNAVSAQVTDGKAAAGTHAIDVRQLAQGQQLASRALPDKGAAIGTGAVTMIKVDIGSGSGATSKTLRIDSGNNTLDGIAKALGQAGLDAKVVQDGKGFSLRLAGPTGAANTLRISVAGDPALQGLLTYAPGGKSAMASIAVAQDAQVIVDGKPISAPTNTLDSTIPGLALTLKQTGVSDVKVTRDPAAAANNVKQFVAAFNAFESSLRALKGSDGANNAMIARVQAEVGQVIGGADAKALAQMGMTRTSEGLTLDVATLNAAIAATPDKVAQLFGAPGTGLAQQLSARVSEHMANGGMLATQAVAAQGSVDKLAAKKAHMTEAIGRQASTLVQQYSQAASGANSPFGADGANKAMSLFDILS